MEYHIPPGTGTVEKLEDFIAVNRLTANTRIPSERDLCEMWGVSRSTFRQAVDTLVGCGILYRVKGSGVFVAVPKISRNMVGVDSMIAELRQQGMFLSKKIISARIIEATKQISRKLKIPLGRKVYEYIRIRKVDYVPCLVESTYIDCQQYPGFDEQYSEKTSMDYLLQNIFHKKQTSGEEHISVTYASEDEAQMLEIESKMPLFFTSGVIDDENGVPITYYKQLIRSDKFKLVSVINRERK
jgi:GntR family transcriptional regulator